MDGLLQTGTPFFTQCRYFELFSFFALPCFILSAMALPAPLPLPSVTWVERVRSVASACYAALILFPSFSIRFITFILLLCRCSPLPPLYHYYGSARWSTTNASVPPRTVGGEENSRSQPIRVRVSRFKIAYCTPYPRPSATSACDV